MLCYLTIWDLVDVNDVLSARAAIVPETDGYH